MASGGPLNTESHAKEEPLHTSFPCLQIGLGTRAGPLGQAGALCPHLPLGRTRTISLGVQYKEGQASDCVLTVV